jgi:hypothetical protein
LPTSGFWVSSSNKPQPAFRHPAAEMLKPKIEAVPHIVARGRGTAERAGKAEVSAAMAGAVRHISPTRLQATFAFHACLLPARRVARAASPQTMGGTTKPRACAVPALRPLFDVDGDVLAKLAFGGFSRLRRRVDALAIISSADSWTIT